MSVTASERVIQRVATATESDELDLPQLYDVIDPDALDTFIEQLADGQITFTYAGYEVTVTSEKTISLD